MTLPTYFPHGYFGPEAVCPVTEAVVGPSAAVYENVTWEELCERLAERLGDDQFWTHEELCMYVVEAIRTWNFLTQYHKERFTFATTAGQAFYDLEAIVPTLRSYSVLDTDLIKLMQYQLLEPPTGTSWTGTEQFTYAQVLDALNGQVNRLRVEAAPVLSVGLLSVPSAPVRRVVLPENTIDLRRAAWVDIDGQYRVLRRRDTAARRSFNVRASYNPAKPIAYNQANLPQMSIELSPPSIDLGQLHITYATAAAELTGMSTAIQVPDDFIPLLKWGALAELLSISASQDIPRANYCAQQWETGIEVADMNPSVIAAEINGRPVPIVSLAAVDSFKPNWQNMSSRPTTLACVGLDIVALAPVPDAVYSITIDIVRKAIVPTAPDDFIQIGPEYIDTLLDYCVHLATFKQGGEEWESTNTLFKGFIDTAVMYNRRLKAESLNFEGITKQAYKEKVERPREANVGGVRS